MTISFLFKARLVCLLSSYRVAFIILNSNKTITTNNPDWVVQELNSQLKTWITKLTTLVQDIETARRQKSKQNSKTKRNIFQRYFSLENKPSSGAKRNWEKWGWLYHILSSFVASIHSWRKQYFPFVYQVSWLSHVCCLWVSQVERETKTVDWMSRLIGMQWDGSGIVELYPMKVTSSTYIVRGVTIKTCRVLSLLIASICMWKT